MRMTTLSHLRLCTETPFQGEIKEEKREGKKRKEKIAEPLLYGPCCSPQLEERWLQGTNWNPPDRTPVRSVYELSRTNDGCSDVSSSIIQATVADSEAGILEAQR